VPAEAHSFDLVDEPWLPCLTLDGKQETLSLRAVLHRSHELRDLVVDVPTQYPPLLRVLLAVLHRSFTGPMTDKEWAALWRHGQVPVDPVDGYLDQHRDRWDLFHPRTPFFQVADLAAVSGETRTVAQLIPHVAAGNNVPLFSGFRDDEPPELNPPDAARWLVHTHAWDTAGIKTGAVGDPTVTGGRAMGNPVGYLGELGVLMPVGSTLFRSLVLNLTVSTYRDGDKPPWERDADGPAWRERPPTGPVDLYTWQTRRIRLFPESQGGRTVVRRCLVTAGDRVPVRLVEAHEPYSRFRRSPAQERKLGVATVFLPMGHDPTRQLWRGLGTMLARAERAVESGDAVRRRPPVLAHLGNTARLDLLAGQVIRVRGIGIQYGHQRAVVNDVYDDELPMPVALLAEQDSVWQTAALRAVEIADGAARALGGLAADVPRAAGSSDQAGGYADRARGRLWASLDGPFRQWIQTLDRPGTDPEERLAGWSGWVKKRCAAIANDILQHTSPVAIRGRPVDAGNPEGRWLNAATAEWTYHARLRKALAPATEGVAA
jgi:CRISPR system Cascade subunit CasA